MKKSFRTSYPLACFVVAIALGGAGIAACGGGKPPPPAEPAMEDTTPPPEPEPEDAGPPAPLSLFDRLGGKEGIEKLVDSLVATVTTNPKLKKSFAKTKDAQLDEFKKNLNDQICEMAGGPCKYAGKDMASAHAKMNVSGAQWDAFVMDLNTAMDESQIGEDEKNELMALFAPMRDDIVKKKK